MKRNVTILLTILLLIFAIPAGFISYVIIENNTSLEKERKECIESETVDKLSIGFRGFYFKNADSVLVKELKNDMPVDSYYIIPQLASEDDYFIAELTGTVYIKHSYIFFIRNQKPYVLSNIRRGARDLYNMIGPVGIRCYIESCEINGIISNDFTIIKETYSPDLENRNPPK